MNKVLLSATIEHFSHQLAARMPGFAPFVPERVPKRPSVLFPLRVSPDLCVFIEILPEPISADQRFMVQIVWNDKPEYPVQAIGKWAGIRLPPFDSPFGIFRLPVLYRKLWNSKREPWWYLGPEQELESGALPSNALPAELAATRKTRIAARTLAKLQVKQELAKLPIQDRLQYVPSVVNDAVQKLIEYGVPFLKQVADAHGCADGPFKPSSRI
jgi:hypothetical protein